MRVPAPPRLAQLAHLFQVNPAAVFGNKNTRIASIRRHQHHQHHQHPHPLPSPTASTTSTSTSSNSEPSSASSADPTFDAEMVPDDRTLVEERQSRRHSSSSSSSSSDAEADDATSSLVLLGLSDVPEGDASYLKFKRRRTVPASLGRRRPASYSERPERLSIIYPLPSAESFLSLAAAPLSPPPLAHGPTPSRSATVIDDASIAHPPLSPPPSPCTTTTPFPLSPPPAHYKRRRARIMSDEEHDSDQNASPDRAAAPIRLLADPNPESSSTLRFPF